LYSKETIAIQPQDQGKKPCKDRGNQEQGIEPKHLKKPTTKTSNHLTCPITPKGRNANFSPFLKLGQAPISSIFT
jgi:hypothetical protein